MALISQISNSLEATGPCGGPGIVGVPSDIFHVCNKCFNSVVYWDSSISKMLCSKCDNSLVIKVTEEELRMMKRNKKLDEILS